VARFPGRLLIGPFDGEVDQIRAAAEPGVASCALVVDAECGIHMVQDKAVRVRGPRPVLGYAVFDDGATYKLDMDDAIGGQPHDHADVVRGAARALVLNDDAGVISAAHARITLRDWDVFVTDCNSVYGTYVWAPASSAWERLTPEEPRRLSTGSQVMLAQRGFMFQPLDKR